MNVHETRRNAYERLMNIEETRRSVRERLLCVPPRLLPQSLRLPNGCL